MKFLLQKFGSIYTLSFFGLILLGVNFFLFRSGVLGLLGLILSLIPLSLVLGNRLFSKTQTENFFLGFLVILCQIIIIGTGIYYVYKITPLLSALIFLVPFLSAGIQEYRSTQKLQSADLSFPKLPIKSLLLPGLVILGDIFLLFYLFKHRTTELSASPWILVSPLFFFVFTLSSVLLFFQYKKNSTQQNIFLTSIHFFVSIAIVAFLYPLGYGFDAFIHRATEEWIRINGFILPKQPYYIGQYTLVTLLSHITTIKIFSLDVFLVPVLSALTLPGIIFSTLKTYVKESSFSFLAFWMLPFIPFLSLYLTTPHNLVLLFTILLVFLSFQYKRGTLSLFVPFLLALSTLATHPLIGAPNMLFVLALFLSKKFETKKVWHLLVTFFTFLSISLLLPLLFTFNALRAGKSFPSLDNPFTHLSNFLELFKRPYWYANTSPIHFEMLYFFERMIVPIVFFFFFIGFISFLKTEKKKSSSIFLATSFGLFSSAFLLRSWIVFPDVVAYEQGDYPLRLIRSSLIFLLPFAMYGFSSLGKMLDAKIQKKFHKTIFSLLCMLTTAFVLTLSLYLSYPQRNVKVRFPGYNVTASDRKAVEWIHAQNSDYSYIVLSNQLLSAAALTNYSFAKYFPTANGEIFYYAIPTGGELYRYYGKMIYEGQKRAYMNEAMNLVGVKKAYFVVHSYWANSQAIVEEAKKTADRFQIFDGGKIWVFEYNKI